MDLKGIIKGAIIVFILTLIYCAISKHFDCYDGIIIYLLVNILYELKR